MADISNVQLEHIREIIGGLENLSCKLKLGLETFMRNKLTYYSLYSNKSVVLSTRDVTIQLALEVQ